MRMHGINLALFLLHGTTSSGIENDFIQIKSFIIYALHIG